MTNNPIEQPKACPHCNHVYEGHHAHPCSAEIDEAEAQKAIEQPNASREAFEAEYASGDPWSDAISLAIREDGQYEQALARLCFKWFCKGQKARHFDWVRALRQAKDRVRSSLLFKKWIDGTPLENDIPVWMTEFAASYAQAEILARLESPELVELIMQTISREYHTYEGIELQTFTLDKMAQASLAAVRTYIEQGGK